MCPPEGRVHFIITADINMRMRSRFDSSCDDATSVQCLHIIANAGLCSVLHPSLGISDWLVRAIAVSIYLLLRGDLAPHWSTSTALTGYWLHIWWFVHKSLSLGQYLFSITLFGCFELIYRTIVISVLCLVKGKHILLFCYAVLNTNPVPTHYNVLFVAPFSNLSEK